MEKIPQHTKQKSWQEAMASVDASYMPNEMVSIGSKHFRIPERHECGGLGSLKTNSISFGTKRIIDRFRPEGNVKKTNENEGKSPEKVDELKRKMINQISPEAFVTEEVKRPRLSFPPKISFKQNEENKDEYGITKEKENMKRKFCELKEFVDEFGKRYKSFPSRRVTPEKSSANQSVHQIQDNALIDLTENKSTDDSVPIDEDTDDHLEKESIEHKGDGLDIEKTSFVQGRGQHNPTDTGSKQTQPDEIEKEDNNSQMCKNLVENKHYSCVVSKDVLGTSTPIDISSTLQLVKKLNLDSLNDDDSSDIMNEEWRTRPIIKIYVVGKEDVGLCGTTNSQSQGQKGGFTTWILSSIFSYLFILIIHFSICCILRQSTKWE